jgi:hypothetical protein
MIHRTATIALTSLAGVQSPGTSMLAPAGTSLTQERRCQHGRRPPLQRVVWRRASAAQGGHLGGPSSYQLIPDITGQ